MPAARARYLAEIAETVRGYKTRARAQARLARELQQLRASRAHAARSTSPSARRAAEAALDLADAARGALDPRAQQAAGAVAATCRRPTPATSTW